MSDKTKKKKRPHPFRLTRKQTLFILILALLIMVALVLIFNTLGNYIFRNIHSCLDVECINYWETQLPHETEAWVATFTPTP